MGSIEHLFQNLGASYTLAKIAGYAVPVLIGFIAWLILKRFLVMRILKIISFIVLVPGVFGLVFMLNPIYEGDFSNNARIVAASGELKADSPRLVVITIPGCPFCMESISRMKAFKEAHPEVNIEYLVCSKDQSAPEPYQAAAGDTFQVHLAKDPQGMAKVAGETFPTFVLNKSGELQVWSNDSFGAGALDEVVAAFQ